MREIEIKLRAFDIDSLEKKIIESGCTLSEPITQQDVIYTQADHGGFENIKEGNIVLRIRKENDKARLTLKQQKTGEMDNLEYETEIGDIVQMDKILHALGWKPEVAVVKTRKKGKLGKYEVCIDRVEQLGDYIELEMITIENADPERVRGELFKTLEPFGLSKNDEETKGYDTLMYFKNKK